MKTTVIALSILMVASIASAQIPVAGQIGLYVDSNHENYCASGTAPYEVTMYVWLKPTTPDGMAASEFKLVYPSNVSYALPTINNDLVSIIIGDPQVGTSIGYTECQHDWHWVFHQKLTVLDQEQSWVVAVADPADDPGGPIMSTCAPSYALGLLQKASNLCINFCTTNLFSPFIWSVTKTDAQHLNVVFSENVTQASAQNIANYTVSDKSTASAPVPVVSAALEPDGVTALLTLGESVIPGRPYLLEARSIYDLEGLAGTSNKGFGDLPDLKFTQFTATPAFRDACSPLHVTCQIRNQGAGMSGPFEMTVEWSPLSGWPGYSPRFLLGRYNYAGLAAGETMTENFIYAWPDTNLTVNEPIFTLDPSNQMPESNEGNNQETVYFIENYTANHLQITDVPGDEGGMIRLTFETTSFGTYFPNPYKTHDIYRRDPGGWTLLTTITDDGRHKYTVDVPTLVDATEDQGIRWSAFKVRTKAVVLPWTGGERDTRYFDSCSCPDSGYSVDNVPPATPGGFTGTMEEGGVLLSWSAEATPDAVKYILYRDVNPNFVPGAGNRIAVVTGALQYFDPEWRPGSNYCYKLSGKDPGGNEGPCTSTIPDQYVATLLESFSFALKETAIELTWKLASIDEGCTFAVYRAQGSGGDFSQIAAPSISRSGLTFTLIDEGISGGESYRYRVEYVSGNATKVLFATETIKTPELPLALYQNFPNPFNPVTTIQYYLPGQEHVRLDVFDASGSRVITLADKVQAKGHHSVEWRGANSSGATVRSGVYFCRLTTRTKTLTNKMVLLR